MNLYGYGAGDPINFDDPFGLCPYEGEKRSMAVSDCSDGRLKDAATLMMADKSGAGRNSLERIMSSGTRVVGTDGVPNDCQGSSPTACFTPGSNTIHINVSGARSDGAVGASFTHEAMHVGENQGEWAAISASLNFFDALPSTQRTDAVYTTLSAMRASNAERLKRIVQDEARRLNQKP